MINRQAIPTDHGKRCVRDTAEAGHYAGDDENAWAVRYPGGTCQVRKPPDGGTDEPADHAT